VCAFYETTNCMDTSAISYRVADFLKQYLPFRVMEQEDLLGLARRGRVKFFEPHQYIVSRGSPRIHVFVVQQGTVLMWDERGAEARLLDVRGAGDVIGIDHMNGRNSYPYTARSASDVLIYAFPSEEFDAAIQKYSEARQYVSAYGSVTADRQRSEERRGPQNIFLHELAPSRSLPACGVNVTIREAAQRLIETAGDSILLVDSAEKPRGILTAQRFLEWIANGSSAADAPASALIDRDPLIVAPDASVADGVIAMFADDTEVLAITADGTLNTRAQAVVTARGLAQVFGDRPAEILDAIRKAVDVRDLRELNRRARSFVLQYLADAASSEWLAAFTSSVDANIIRRIISFAGAGKLRAAWCFCGAAGRGESLTSLAPQVVVIGDDAGAPQHCVSSHQRVLELLDECGYLPNIDATFEPRFYAATASEWKHRYDAWLGDPILKQIYAARSFFDLRFIAGDRLLWSELETAVTPAINPQVLHVVANDCLATLPPLTFFQNAVVDETGEETAIFRLEETALRPLVDVGRVFGLAAKNVFGCSTLERFATARLLVPEQASIFEEASETLRVVLWLQGRIGISQGTAGLELPPAQLSRYDQQLLRNGFRSILRLLEFTAESSWLKNLQ
jgi:CBS domain-containing protein